MHQKITVSDINVIYKIEIITRLKIDAVGKTIIREITLKPIEKIIEPIRGGRKNRAAFDIGSKFSANNLTIGLK